MDKIDVSFLKIGSIKDVLRKYINEYGDHLILPEDIQTYEGTVSFRIPTTAKNMLQQQAKLLGKTTSQHIADLTFIFQEQFVEDK